MKESSSFYLMVLINISKGRLGTAYNKINA